MMKLYQFNKLRTEDIIVGSTSSFGAGNRDVYLIRTDSIGDSLWTKTFGGTDLDYGYSIQQTIDGGCIITGTYSTLSASNGEAYLIKTDANGDSLWTRSFGGAEHDLGWSVQQTADGGYIIVGNSSYGASAYDEFLIKTDANGNSGCNEASTATIVTSPATQVTNPATIVTSPNTTVTNPATIVGSGGIDSTLCRSVGVNEIKEGSLFNIFPNPASSQFTILNSQCIIDGIEVCNLLGEKMRIAVAVNRGLWTVDCRLFPTGIYFVKGISENGSETQKLVVQH